MELSQIEFSQMMKQKLQQYQSLELNKKIDILDWALIKLEQLKPEEIRDIFDENIHFEEFLKINNPRINELGVRIILEYVQKCQPEQYVFDPVQMTKILLTKIYINRKNLEEFCESILRIFLTNSFEKIFWTIVELFLEKAYPKLTIGCLDFIEKIFLLDEFHVGLAQVAEKFTDELEKLLENGNKQVRDKGLVLLATLIQRNIVDSQRLQSLLKSLKKNQLTNIIGSLDEQQLETLNIAENQQRQDDSRQISEKIKECKVKHRKLQKEQPNGYLLVNKQKPVIFFVNNIPVAERPVNKPNHIVQYRENKPINYNPQLIQQKKKEIQELGNDVDALQQNFNYYGKYQSFREQQTLLQTVHQVFTEQPPKSYCFEIFWNLLPWLDGKPVILPYVFEIIQVYITKVSIRQLKVTFLTETLSHMISISSQNQKNPKIYKSTLEILNGLFRLNLSQEIFSILTDNLMNANNTRTLTFNIHLVVVLLKNWGITYLNDLQDFLPHINKLSVSLKQEVRSICLEFYTEAYKWMGNSLLQKLKSISNRQYVELTQILGEIELKPLSSLQNPELLYDPVNQQLINKLRAENLNKEEEEEKKIDQIDDASQIQRREEQKLLKFQDDAFRQMQEDFLNDLEVQFKDKNLQGEMEQIIENLQHGEQLSDDQKNHLEQNLLLLLGCKKEFNANQIIIMCKEWGSKLKEQFSSVSVNIFPVLIEKFLDKTVDNNILTQTLFVLQKYLSPEFVLESIRPNLLRSKCQIQHGCLNLLQKIFDQDVKDQRYASHVEVLEKELQLLTKDKDHNLKTLVLNLIAKIIQVYEEDPIYPLINQLKKREVNRIDRNVEKFEFIHDAKKFYKQQKSLQDSQIKAQNEGPQKEEEKKKPAEEEEIDEI